MGTVKGSVLTRLRTDINMDLWLWLALVLRNSPYGVGDPGEVAAGPRVTAAPRSLASRLANSGRGALGRRMQRSPTPLLPRPAPLDRWRSRGGAPPRREQYREARPSAPLGDRPERSRPG